MALFSAWQWWLLEHKCSTSVFLLLWSLDSATMCSPLRQECLVSLSAPQGCSECMLQPDSSPLPRPTVSSTGCIHGTCLCSSPFPPPVHSDSPIFRCFIMQLSDMFVCWIGNPLLNYSCSSCFKFKGRDQGDLSHHHASDITLLVLCFFLIMIYLVLYHFLAWILFWCYLCNVNYTWRKH